MASSVSVDQDVAKTESRRGVSWNRVFHRVGGLFASLLMLWIAGTGIGMQLLDLKAILTHEAPTDPQELSMKEGQYGPANFAVIQVSDFTAPALPQSFNINQGVVTVLQALHAQQGQNQGGSGAANALRGGNANVPAHAPNGGSPIGPGGNGGDKTGPRPTRGQSGLRSAQAPASTAPPNDSGPGSTASGGGRQQMSSDDRVAAIDEAIKLTGDQKTRIKAIYDANGKKAADIRAAQDPDMRDKLTALRADQNTQIETVLTIAQKPGFEAYLASSEPQGRGPGGAASGGRGNSDRAATGAAKSPTAGGPGGDRGEGQSPRASGARQESADAAPGGRQGRGQGGGQASDAAYNPLSWVELRMVNGVPTGQAMVGTKLAAFNAVTGDAVTPVAPVNIPQGRGLPPSLRQKLKTLHRFWDRSDTPGVYFEFLSGIILWCLIISGLIMYFRLLGARARQGRSNLFWIKGGGGWWRGLHRVISVIAAVFLLWMSFTGTWIGFESSVGPIKRLFVPKPIALQPTAAQAAAGVAQPQGQVGGGQPAQTQQPGNRTGGPGGAGPRGGGMRNAVDFILPLRDLEVRQMAAVTLNSMQQLHPALPIKAIRLRTYGQTKQGVVITGGDETRQFVFNADSGQPASLSEQGYPEGGFPFGTQVHENIKHLHSGDYFGIPARLMNLFAGFCLTFLSISGLYMYFDMWRKRRRAGRKSLLWA